MRTLLAFLAFTWSCQAAIFPGGGGANISAGTNVVFGTNNGVVVIHSTAIGTYPTNGVAVAKGTNITLITNGLTVTVHGTGPTLGNVTNVARFFSTNLPPRILEGTNVVLVTNDNAITVHSAAPGVTVAQGTNVVCVTNGSVVTVHSTATGTGTGSGNVDSNNVYRLTWPNNSLPWTMEATNDGAAVYSVFLRQADLNANYEFNWDPWNYPNSNSVVTLGLLSNVVGTVTEGSTLFVSTSGNDSTAVIGRPDKPWLTLSNAVQSAPNNSVIQVYPGTYTNLDIVNSGEASGLAPINVSFKTNLAILGTGAQFYWPTQLTGIRVYGCSNVLLSGFTIANKKGTDANGNHPLWVSNSIIASVCGMIEIAESASVRMNGLTLSGGYDHGILYRPGDGNVSNNIVVESCTFANVGGQREAVDHYDGAAVVPAAGWRVVNCTFLDCNRGIEPYPDDNLISAEPPCILANNLFIGTHNESFLVDRGRAVIQGNVVYRGPTHTNWATGQGSIYMRYAKDCVIEGNIIQNSVITALLSLKPTNVTVKGNLFLGAREAVRFEEGGVNISVEGNTFRDCGDAAIMFLSSAGYSQVSISDNIGSGQATNSGTHSYASAIYIGSCSVTNLLISGNSFRAHAAANVFGIWNESATLINCQAINNSFINFNYGPANFGLSDTLLTLPSATSDMTNWVADLNLKYAVVTVTNMVNLQHSTNRPTGGASSSVILLENFCGTNMPIYVPTNKWVWIGSLPAVPLTLTNGQCMVLSLTGRGPAETNVYAALSSRP